MTEQAGGQGEAADATVDNDKSYADKLRERTPAEGPARIAAAEAAVEQAKADLETAKEALAIAKKENG